MNASGYPIFCVLFVQRKYYVTGAKQKGIPLIKRKHYSPQLLSNTFFENQIIDAVNIIQLLKINYLNKNLSDYEFTSLVLFYFNWLTHQSKSVGGKRNSQKIGQLKSNVTLEAACEMLKIPMRWPENSNQSFFEFYIQRSHRQIPESALISLELWALQKYSLKLMFRIPSVYEVLKMQSQGSRCVSVLDSEADLRNANHAGRDVFSFILHDLIHADHFFHNQVIAQAQIQFANKMLLLFDHSFIQNALLNDSIFQNEFDYLVSDMNTVPLHLLKSLKAIILRFYKRNYQIPQNHHLPEEIEFEFQTQFDNILKLWNFSPEAYAIAKKLNTNEFNPQIDGLLLSKELVNIDNPRP